MHIALQKERERGKRASETSSWLNASWRLLLLLTTTAPRPAATAATRASTNMDGAPPDDNFDALPVEQRLSHKVRVLPHLDSSHSSWGWTVTLCEPVLTHTMPCVQVWKARLSAYAEVASLAAKTPDDHDPFFREPFLSASSLREWVRDANAVAQEKGVEAACAVVEFGGRSMSRCVWLPRRTAALPVYSS